VQNLNYSPQFEDPLDLVPRTLSKLYTLWLRLTYPFALMGCGVSFHYTFKANRAMASRMKLGNWVTAGKDVWLNIIPEATDEINIIIDDDCRIGPRTWISAKNQIHLEQDVHLGNSVLIQDHGHAYENPDLPISKQPAMEGGRIRIERGCRIGQGVAIVCTRGELVLGQHCVVIPNSVVIRSAPSYCVLGGNPARVIERLDSSQANPESPSYSIGKVVFKASV
jgi:acetyltransferase-like isoleucine patch superfamily enzyme